MSETPYYHHPQNSSEKSSNGGSDRLNHALRIYKVEQPEIVTIPRTDVRSGPYWQGMDLLVVISMF